MIEWEGFKWLSVRHLLPGDEIELIGETPNTVVSVTVDTALPYRRVVLVRYSTCTCADHGCDPYTIQTQRVYLWPYSQIKVLKAMPREAEPEQPKQEEERY